MSFGTVLHVYVSCDSPTYQSSAGRVLGKALCMHRLIKAPQRSYASGTVIIPISQMGRLRPREVK